MKEPVSSGAVQIYYVGDSTVAMSLQSLTLGHESMESVFWTTQPSVLQCTWNTIDLD